MGTVKKSEADLDLLWANNMKWARDSAERADWEVVLRMIRANSNFYGLRHLQPLRKFLEEIGDGG
jgi:hypothetical protein